MYKLLKNFIFLFAGNLLSKVLSFFVTIIIVRTISVEWYGIFKWYNTIISYLILFLNLGYDTYFYKLIINQKYPVEKAIALQLKTRLWIALLIIIVSYVILLNLNIPLINKVIFCIMLSQLIFYSLNIEIFYRIREQFFILSLIMVISSVLNLILLYSFVNSENDIIDVVLVTVIGNFILVAFLWIFARRFIQVKLKKVIIYVQKLKFHSIFYHVKRSIIINISYFMINIYYNLDTLMLGIFRSEKEVALYSAAYTFLLIAIMPTNILFSAFSSYLSKNKYVKNVFINYFSVTFLMGILLFGFFFIFHKEFILMAYGSKYENATDVLFWLSFDIIPCYLAGAFANPINLWGDYKSYLTIVSIGAIGNLIGNIIAIPLYGIKGAIFTTILSEVLVTIGGLIYWKTNKRLLK